MFLHSFCFDNCNGNIVGVWVFFLWNFCTTKDQVCLWNVWGITVLNVVNVLLILNSEYLTGDVTYGQIVDFCCGANDFSILMNKKLEETGKRCLYKNYDLLPTKVNILLQVLNLVTLILVDQFFVHCHCIVWLLILIWQIYLYLLRIVYLLDDEWLQADPII